MNKKIKILILISILIVTLFTFLKLIKIDDIILKQIYPLKYNEYIEKYAKEYDIDKYLIYAIIKAESNFDQYAKSSRNAIGLMQILEPTAIETAKKMNLSIGEEELFNPEVNINIGVKYFDTLLKKYNNNYKIAIIAYNAGIGNVDEWIKNNIIKTDGTNLENVPFKETNNYLRKILRDYKIYKDLYE